MADDVRQEKVAAGLKKLRNFQQRTRKNRVENHKTNLETINLQEESSSPPLAPSENSIPGSPSCASEENADFSSTYSESQLSSSKESLRQLRQQVNGLMSETDSYLNGEVGLLRDTEGLEQRNQELAAMLDQQQQQISQLQAQLQRKQEQLSQEQANSHAAQDATMQLKSEEVATLQQQLQVHIQTIGILVAEKTELQSSLSLSQQTVTTKTEELEELQSKLKALRLKLAEREREFTSISQFNEMSDKNTKELSSELERERKENEKLRKLADQYKHQAEELNEKYHAKVLECKNLEQAAQETRNQLQLAQLYSQQLQAPSEVLGQMEALQNERMQLETALIQARERQEELIQEREGMARAHQAHLAQCSMDLATVREELGHLTQQLAQRTRETEHLREQLEAATTSVPPEPATTVHLEEELGKLQAQLDQVSAQNEELTNLLSQMEQDNQALNKLAAEQESALVRWQEQEVDREKLLASIQSDKVAASRATAQNKELKSQLEELQAALISHSNSKLQLTEELSHERHISKELGERLGQQEEELNQLHQEVMELRKKALVMSQLEDKMRHYEVQQAVHSDMAALQKRLEEVKAQNVELRSGLARQAQESLQGEPTRELARKDDLVAALSASVQQLEAERNQLLHTMGEQQSQRSSLQAQLSQLNAQDVTARESVVSQEEFSALKSSMEQLEEKFRQTMNRVAELSDEKQHLEHLVTQLQGETETIGDYIHLYQVQRGLMKKREVEKDEYIALLAQDRENLKEQLRDLQVLVEKLVQNHQKQESGGEPEQVTTHIQELLHHLECQNLLESSSPPAETFHPCQFCSGKLLNL